MVDYRKLCARVCSRLVFWIDGSDFSTESQAEKAVYRSVFHRFFLVTSGSPEDDWGVVERSVRELDNDIVTDWLEIYRNAPRSVENLLPVIIAKAYATCGSGEQNRIIRKASMESGEFDAEAGDVIQIIGALFGNSSPTAFLTNYNISTGSSRRLSLSEQILNLSGSASILDSPCSRPPCSRCTDLEQKLRSKTICLRNGERENEELLLHKESVEKVIFELNEKIEKKDRQLEKYADYDLILSDNTKVLYELGKIKEENSRLQKCASENEVLRVKVSNYIDRLHSEVDERSKLESTIFEREHSTEKLEAELNSTRGHLEDLKADFISLEEENSALKSALESRSTGYEHRSFESAPNSGINLSGSLPLVNVTAEEETMQVQFLKKDLQDKEDELTGLRDQLLAEKTKLKEFGGLESICNKKDEFIEILEQKNKEIHRQFIERNVIIGDLETKNQTLTWNLESMETDLLQTKDIIVAKSGEVKNLLQEVETAIEQRTFLENAATNLRDEVNVAENQLQASQVTISSVESKLEETQNALEGKCSENVVLTEELRSQVLKVDQMSSHIAELQEIQTRISSAAEEVKEEFAVQVEENKKHILAQELLQTRIDTFTSEASELNQRLLETEENGVQLKLETDYKLMISESRFEEMKAALVGKNIEFDSERDRLSNCLTTSEKELLSTKEKHETLVNNLTEAHLEKVRSFESQIESITKDHSGEKESLIKAGSAQIQTMESSNKLAEKKLYLKEMELSKTSEESEKIKAQLDVEKEKVSTLEIDLASKQTEFYSEFQQMRDKFQKHAQDMSQENSKKEQRHIDRFNQLLQKYQTQKEELAFAVSNTDKQQTLVEAERNKTEKSKNLLEERLELAQKEIREKDVELKRLAREIVERNTLLAREKKDLEVALKNNQNYLKEKQRSSKYNEELKQEQINKTKLIEEYESKLDSRDKTINELQQFQSQTEVEETDFPHDDLNYSLQLPLPNASSSLLSETNLRRHNETTQVISTPQPKSAGNWNAVEEEDIDGMDDIRQNLFSKSVFCRDEKISKEKQSSKNQSDEKESSKNQSDEKESSKKQSDENNSSEQSSSDSKENIPFAYTSRGKDFRAARNALQPDHLKTSYPTEQELNTPKSKLQRNEGFRHPKKPKRRSSMRALGNSITKRFRRNEKDD